MRIRTIFFILFLAVLNGFGIGCSEKHSGSKDQSPSPYDAAQLRSDASPPRISAITVGPYYDELENALVDFEIRKTREGTANVHFHRFVTHWKVDPTDREDQRNFLAREKQLPYFIVTVDDADTPLENLTLYYAFERKEDDAKAPLSYLVAEKYKFGKLNQWLVILSEETAGLTLNSFAGEKSFVLHLKAVDSGKQETKGGFPFKVTNLQPPLHIFKDPDYRDEKSYPENLVPALFWAESHFKKNLGILRAGGEISTSLFLIKFVIENKHPFEMLAKVAFRRGRLNYSTEKRFEKRDGKTLEVVNLYSKAWSNAPVFVFVGNEKGTLANIEGGERQFAYSLSPSDLSLGEKGRSELFLYFVSDFKFRNEHPEETTSQSTLSPNVFVDRIAMDGDLIIHTAPAGLPEAYYKQESNWLDQSGRPDIEVSLVSNQ